MIMAMIIKAKDSEQYKNKAITATTVGDKEALDTYIQGGTDLTLSLPTPLKADRVTAISTDGGSVAQTGILAADLYNSGNTTITAWFGEAPATGKAIYLSPGQSWSGYLNNKSGLYYDSDVAGGQLDYVLLG
jgi:hypothetical protein